MNMSRKYRALAASAVICGVATQAALASARVNCRAEWGQHIKQCQSDTDKVEANSLDTGGTGRLVQVFFFAGTVNAEASALDINGVPVTGCRIPISGAGPNGGGPSGFGAGVNCNSPTPPAFLFVTAD